MSPLLTLRLYLFCYFLLQVLLAPLFRKMRELWPISAFPLQRQLLLLAVAAGIWTVENGTTEKAILVLGTPDLPFHLRLDPLSGFFLTTIGLLSFYVSVYSIGYVRGFIGQRPVMRLVIFYSFL